MLRATLMLPVLALLIAASLPAGESTKSKEKEKPKDTLSAEERQVFDLTNAERKKEGLPPLRLSPLLTRLAKAHSENMAKQGKLDHSLDGKNPVERAKEAGYRMLSFGENIYAGFGKTGEPPAALDWWMNSKPHRANILSKMHREIGVGVAKGEGQTYYTQVFGTPLGR
jgi:uncharacterized protein YkwD